MSANGKIPFLDLLTPHRELGAELVGVFNAALSTAGFVGGPMVEEFEREFAAFCDAAKCVGVGSGTDALRFALVAAGVKPGDTVLTVPNTFIATTETISQVGARFDFVEVDDRTYTMDPEKLRVYLETECRRDSRTNRMVSRRTGSVVTALIPVHLYGQMADMDPLLALADRYNLILIEDACQAHGAEYFSEKEKRWRKAGSMGHAAAFSFYPGKNLGACGEAGAVTTNDEGLAREVRMLRDHGQSRKYYHDVEGYNGRLDAIQAGILRVKLHHLALWNEQRRQAAERYNELFAPMRGSIAVPYQPAWSRPVYHLYVIRTSSRDELQQQTGDFPVSEEAAKEILSLPMFPGLRAEDQRRVVDVVEEFASARSAS